MVSGYEDGAKADYLEAKGIEVLRGAARLAGRGRVEVDGQEHSPDHVVIATGSDAVIPPVPGLREIDGIWTNREATALTEVPHRLLVLGGGPVGVEMAQAAAYGRLVALVEGMDHVLPREPKPLGDALGSALEPTASSFISASTRAASAAMAGSYVLEFEGRDELRGDRLLVATGRRPRARGARPGNRRRRADAPRHTGRRPHARDGGRLGDRRRDGHLAAHLHGQVPGPRGRGEHPRRRARRELRRRPAGGVHGSPGGRRRRADGPLTATVPLSEVPRTATYTRAYADSPGFMTLVSDGERLTGAYALGPEAGGGSSRRRSRSAPACRSK